MEILIVRHGHAVDNAPGLGDDGRWLSGKGRKTTRRVARWLAKRPKRCPQAIWTSPLVRAVQTAEILAEAAGIEDGVIACAELSPGRDPGDLVNRLEQHNGPSPLALVGHEPSLSVLATLLLGEPDVPEFKKSGVLALSFEHGKAKLRFAFDPMEMKRTRFQTGANTK